MFILFPIMFLCENTNADERISRMWERISTPECVRTSGSETVKNLNLLFFDIDEKNWNVFQAVFYCHRIRQVTAERSVRSYLHHAVLQLRDAQSLAAPDKDRLVSV